MITERKIPENFSYKQLLKAEVQKHCSSMEKLKRNCNEVTMKIHP